MTQLTFNIIISFEYFSISICSPLLQFKLITNSNVYVKSGAMNHQIDVQDLI